MWGKRRPKLIDSAAGLLARLRRDSRGNTLAMMAAMMIPLAAITGSAIDMGRLYAVKSRLQQACDAGALAGRKAMLISKSGTFSADASNTAKAFFTNNFKDGWYNSSSTTFAAKMVAGSNTDVQGDATTIVPMTIMQMVFQVAPKTVAVTCTARYEVADSDVMFVLDTTGSMADPAPSGGSTKIEGVKSAVMTFYDTMDAAKAAQPDTNIRYGFVTYASSVNVGRILYAANPSYLTLAWQYHTRELAGDQNAQFYDSQSKTIKDIPPVTSTQNLSRPDCTSLAGRNPVAGYTSNGSAVVTTIMWNANVCSISAQTVGPKWRYFWKQNATFPTALLAYGGTVPDPTKAPPGAVTSWAGCIEERTTDHGATSYTSLPADLDPDLVPNSDATRWKPLWSDIVYWRGDAGTEVIDTAPSVPKTPSATRPYGDQIHNSLYYYTAPEEFTNLTSASGRGTCGQEARRLKVMARGDVQSYVQTLTAQGNTYHDLGMIWGTRLLSPTGLFANDTAPWPNRPAPNRYIVFMTDGQMAPNATSYTSYGIEQYDQRVTGGSLGQDTNYHNARFLAECAAAKARNITVFTVGFGTALTSQLKSCASLPSYAVQASSNEELKTAFQQIAQKVAQLRLQQ